MIKLGNSVERQNEFLGPEYLLVLKLFFLFFIFHPKTSASIAFIKIIICMFVYLFFISLKYIWESIIQANPSEVVAF